MPVLRLVLLCLVALCMPPASATAASPPPAHLPGSYFVDRDHPEATRVELQSPAQNTVRLGESYLLVPRHRAAPARQR